MRGEREVLSLSEPSEPKAPGNVNVPERRAPGAQRIAASAWTREVEFDAWLERRLERERSDLMARVQASLSERLESHHRALLEQLDGEIGSSFPAATRSRTTGSGPADRVFSPHSVLPAEAGVQAQLSKSNTPEEAVLERVRISTDSRMYKSNYIATLAHQPYSFLPADRQRCRCFRSVVANQYFEVVTCAIIVLNTLMMAAEVQYIGCEVSFKMNHPDCSAMPSQDWPGLATFFTVGTAIFTFCFFTEFGLRLGHLRVRAFRSAWMWFDLVVLVFGSLDTLSRLGSAAELIYINPSVMRTARVVRMLRIIKVLRTKDTFYTLFLLMKSILASRHALGWSALIMYFAMTSVGMLINQITYIYMSDPNVSEEDRQEVYNLFGTYTRTLTTMCELTLGNWAPVSRTLMNNISQWWGLFIVVYRCVFCLAFVNVTSAVFLTETQRVAADDEVLMMRKEFKARKDRRVLGELFEEIDESGDGYVTLSEFALTLQDDKVLTSLLELMELDVENVEELFHMMDDGTGTVAKERFIDSILAIRGQAKLKGQTRMMKLVQSIDKRLDEVCKHVPTDARTRKLT